MEQRVVLRLLNPHLLRYSVTPFQSLFSLDVGQRRFKRGQIPKILDLEIIAFEGTGETIKLQIVLRRVSGTAVIGKYAVLHGLFEERHNFTFQLGRQIVQQARAFCARREQILGWR